MPPARFPRSLAVMLSHEQADAIEAAALNQQRSKADVVRERLDAGAELVSISEQYGAPLFELVNAARLYALRASGTSASSTVVTS
jgi:hypothetical protein